MYEITLACLPKTGFAARTVSVCACADRLTRATKAILTHKPKRFMLNVFNSYTSNQAISMPFLGFIVIKFTQKFLGLISILKLKMLLLTRYGVNFDLH